jgi:hypothetical protein
MTLLTLSVFHREMYNLFLNPILSGLMTFIAQCIACLREKIFVSGCMWAMARDTFFGL